MEINKKIEIEVPSVPNFILGKEKGQKWSISEFSETDLREIGAEWTEKLIREAKKKSIKMR